MACRAIHSWSLVGLIVAFVELAIAYFLLCVSASVFVPSKFLSVFGLYLPCPCSGLFGYQNCNLCWHELLICWPIRMIYSVQDLVKTRFPFDLTWFKDQSCNLCVEGIRDKCENGVVAMESEACSSSFSSPRLQSYMEREGGYDAKGKRVMNHKQKSGVRRRRRAALGYGKFSPNSTISGGRGAPHNHNDGNEMRSEISENLDPVSFTEDGLLDSGNALNGIDFGERILHSFDLTESCDTGKGIIKDLASIENFTRNAEERLGNVGNDVDAIRFLEKALEDEKADRAALYQELEKERAASASAADEALAMIMRLQEDKAAIEMEARQYQRMIEEKFSYDEEEMDILKEVLIRRERENHFLEKELEAFRQMNLAENGMESDSSFKLNNSKQRPSLSVESSKDPPPLLQQIENIKPICEKGVATNADWSSSYEQSQTLASDNNEPSVGKGKSLRDISIVSRVTKVPQTCGDVVEEEEIDGELWSQASNNINSSLLDAESSIYDVHVIDDRTIVQKENGGNKSGPLSSAALYSGVWDNKILSDIPCMSVAEIDLSVNGTTLDVGVRSAMATNSQCKTMGIESQMTSSSSANSERLKIDTEVEWLRERLQVVQREKGKLSFSMEHKEKMDTQLKLMEDILNQLQEIQHLREPVQQASLPPSSKVSLKKRRCRSVPLEAFGSS